MSRVAYRTASELPLVTVSGGDTLWNRTGSWRYLRPRRDERAAPCAEACPAGQDIARVAQLAAEGKWEEAWNLLLRENPLPGVMGRVCFHPCEASCNRGSFDEPLAFHAIERAAADRAREAGWTPRPSGNPPTGRRAAVVGAGPAGLTAAWHLARFGHGVDLFDAREEPGGMLRYAIPAYRLPPDVLAWETGLILDHGVRFHPGRTVGGNLSWDELRGYDAVFLAAGAWTPVKLGIPGEELARDGLAFLESVRRGAAERISGPVAVLGGGNTAVDAARTLVRLGAAPTIYYRRRFADMPALPEELRAAAEEGVAVRELLAPARIERMDGNRLRLLLAPQSAKPAEAGRRAEIAPSGAPDEAVEVSAVFSAVGAVAGLPAGGSRPLSGRLHSLSIPGGGPPLFLGGDLVNAERTVATAVGSGKEAALAFHLLLGGREPDLAPFRVGAGGSVRLALHPDGGGSLGPAVSFAELNTAYFDPAPRAAEPHLDPEARRGSFAEVAAGLSEEAALAEAARCFHCGTCDECDNCRIFCPDMAVIREGGERRFDYDYCKGCGICAAECPRRAIALEEEATEAAR